MMGDPLGEPSGQKQLVGVFSPCGCSASFTAWESNSKKVGIKLHVCLSDMNLYRVSVLLGMAFLGGSL